MPDIWTMAIESIEQWLRSDKDYAAGLTLVHRYSKNSFLLKVLDKGATSFNRHKLLSELIELNNAELPKPEGVVIRKKILSDEEFASAPFDIRRIENQAKELIKQNGKRHSEINTLINESRKLFPGNPYKQQEYLDDHHLGDKANIILDTDDEIAALFHKIDFWKIHRKLPDEAALSKIAGKDPAQIKQELQNIRSRISKEKKKPDFSTSMKMKQLESQRDLLQSELDELI